MNAEALEKFVADAAIRLLTGLVVNPRRRRSAVVEAAEREIAADERQIRDLHEMWLNKEIDSAEYRRDRRTIQARIRENEKKTIAKAKSPESVGDLIGPDAKVKWKRSRMSGRTVCSGSCSARSSSARVASRRYPRRSITAGSRSRKTNSADTL
jgi:hypothetical protein